MTAVHSRSVAGGGAVLRTATGERDAAEEGRRPGPDEYDPTSLDAFYGLLKNERRRRVVRYLDGESPTTTLSDLAEHIAAIENDKPKRALNAQERKRVYIQLYQYHLPAMDEVGVITFDGDRGTVERTPKADHLTELLDADGASPSTGPRSTPAHRQSSNGGRQSSEDVRQPSGADPQSAGGDRQPPGGGRQPSRFPTGLDTLTIYYLGLGLVGAGLFGLHSVRPVPAVVGGAVAGVLLMAAVSCLLMRAAGERPTRTGATDGVPDSPASSPAADGVPDRTGAGGDGRPPRGTVERLRERRLRRHVVERPSSSGTNGGSAD